MFSLNVTNANTSAVKYKNLVTANNDPTTTKAQTCAALAESSKVQIAYKAANSGSLNTPVSNPNFQGTVSIQGNINISPALGLAGQNSGSLNVFRDTNIGGNLYVNNISVYGNMYFPNSVYGLNVQGIYSTSIYSVVQNTNSVYVNSSSPSIMIILGRDSRSQICFSTNGGISWSTCTMGSTFTNNTSLSYGIARNAAWNGSYWIATGYGYNSLAYSADGITWRGVEPMRIFNVGNSGRITYGGAYGIAWNGVMWVASGYSLICSLAYSKNGTTWAPCANDPFANSGGGYGTSVAYNGTIWVAGGAGFAPAATLAYSYDGMNWTAVDSSFNYTLDPGCTSVTWNGNMWLATGGEGNGLGGNNFAYSYDGVRWTGYYSSVFTSTVNGAAWNSQQGMWIAVGSYLQGMPGINTMAFSYDGLTWTGMGNTLFTVMGTGIMWSNGTWVATGTGRYTVAYSKDGVRWTGSNQYFTVFQIANGTASNTTGTLFTAGRATFGDSATVSHSLFVNGNIDANGTAVGSLLVRGGVTTTGNAYLGNNLVIRGTADAGSTSSGSLLVQGGMTVVGNLFADRTVVLTSTADATAPTSGALVVQGGAGIVGNLVVGNNATVMATLNVANVMGNLIQGNTLQANRATVTSTGAGALSVVGGATISGNLTLVQSMLAQATVYCQSTQDATAPTSGSLVVVGGAGISKTLAVGGAVVVAGTADATGPNAGALTVAGGAGVGQSMYVGNNMYVGNSLYVTNTINLNTSGTNDATSTGSGALAITGGLGVSKSVFIGNSITVYGTQNSTSVTTGGIILSGGLGIGKDVTVGGNLQVNNLTMGGRLTATAVNALTDVSVNNNVIVGSMNNVVFSSGSGATGTLGSIYTNLPTTLFATTDAVMGANAQINGTVDATGTATGALRVMGGASVGRSLFIGNSVTIQGTANATGTATGALVVKGGVGIGADTYVQGNVTVNNYVLQRISNTNNTYMGYTDAPFSFNGGQYNTVLGYNSGTYGYPVGATTPSYNTFVGGNIALQGAYNMSTALGYGARITDSNQIVLGTATETLSIPGSVAGADTMATGQGAVRVMGGLSTTGNVVVGNTAWIYGTRDATNTGTGSLVVGGGVGISANVYVGRTLTILGNTDGNATSTAVGSLVVAGGVGVGGSVVTGGAVKILNTSTLSALTVAGGATLGQSLSVGGNTFITGPNVTMSGSTVAIAGNVSVGGATAITGSLTVGASGIVFPGGSTMTSLAANGNLTLSTNTSVLGGINASQYLLNNVPFSINTFSGDASFNNGTLFVNSAAAATTTSTGSLRVAGGIGVAGNVVAGQNVNAPAMQTAAMSVPYTTSTSLQVVAVGSAGMALSIDGFTWSPTTFVPKSGGPIVGSCLAWNGTMWVGSVNYLVTSNLLSDIIYSYDGNRWTTVANVFNAQPQITRGANCNGVAWNGTQWIMVGYGLGSSSTNIYNSSILSSSNGVSWTNVPNVTGFVGNGVAWNGNMWVAVGQSSAVSGTPIRYSYNGIQWFNTVTTYSEGTVWNQVAWSGRGWVAVGNGLIALSYDGTNWTTVYTNAAVDVNSVAWNGNQWIAVTSYSAIAPGGVLGSTDGITWSRLTTTGLSATNSYYGVTWNATQSIWYVATETAGIYYSYNGLAWTQTNNDTSQSWHTVAWNGTGTLQVAGTATVGSLSVLNSAAVVSSTTSWSPNTGAMVINGGIGIGGNVYVGANTVTKNLTVLGNVVGAVNVTSTVPATSTGSAALVVAGGVGIGGNLFVGGQLSMGGQMTFNNYLPTSSLTPSQYNQFITYGFAENTYARTQSSFIQNNNLWNGTNTFNGIIQNNLAIQGDGTIYTSATADATSPDTGSLQVARGAGIGGSLYVGGSTVIMDLTTQGPIHNLVGMDGSGTIVTFATNAATSTGTGALVVAGGVGIAGDVYIGGNTYMNKLTLTGEIDWGDIWMAGNITTSSTTPATSVATGALVVAGGVGIAGNLFVGGTTNIVTVNTASTTSNNLQINGDANVTGTTTTTNLNVNGTASVSGKTTLTTLTATSATAGTLQVTGGTSLTTLTATAATTGTLQVTGSAGIQDNITAGGYLTVSSYASIASTTQATSTDTGALIVAGGAGIAGNLQVGGGLVAYSTALFTNIQETIQVASTFSTMSSNTLDYSLGAILYIPYEMYVDVSYGIDLINLPFTVGSATTQTYVVSIVNASSANATVTTNNVVCNALTVNGNPTPFIYNGGYSVIPNTICDTVVQQFIVMVIGGIVVQVYSGVSQYMG